MASEQIVAIVPARAGSKRLPGKNMALLGGEPLVAYTLRAALGAKRLSRVVVSTDDAELARFATAAGVEVFFPRPAELATDTASVIDVLRHVVHVLEEKGESVDVVVLLQPTSPFRTNQHIDAALELFTSSRVDTVTTVRPVSEHPYWLWVHEQDHLSPLYAPEHIAMGRHQLPPYYVETGAIYIVSREVLSRDGLYGDRVVPFLMNELASVDIDTPLDLAWADFLLTQHSGLLKG